MDTSTLSFSLSNFSTSLLSFLYFTFSSLSFSFFSLYAPIFKDIAKHKLLPIECKWGTTLNHMSKGIPCAFVNFWDIIDDNVVFMCHDLNSYTSKTHNNRSGENKTRANQTSDIGNATPTTSTRRSRQTVFGEWILPYSDAWNVPLILTTYTSEFPSEAWYEDVERLLK